MSTCAICNVSSGSAEVREENLTFHRLPKNESARAKWFAFCGIDPKDGQDHTKLTLCSRHFENRCLKRQSWRTQLIPGSVPTLLNPVKVVGKSGGVVLLENTSNLYFANPVKIVGKSGTIVPPENTSVLYFGRPFGPDHCQHDDSEKCCGIVFSPEPEYAEIYRSVTRASGQKLESKDCSGSNPVIPETEPVVEHNESSGSFLKNTNEEKSFEGENGDASVVPAEDLILVEESVPEHNMEVILSDSEPFIVEERVPEPRDERKELLQKLKNELCRICSEKKEVLVPIYYEDDPEEAELTLAKKLEMYLPVQISTSGKLPLNICLKCHDLVESWHELYVACSAADSVLREVFGAEEDEAIPDIEKVEEMRFLNEDYLDQDSLEDTGNPSIDSELYCPEEQPEIICDLPRNTSEIEKMHVSPSEEVVENFNVPSTSSRRGLISPPGIKSDSPLSLRRLRRLRGRPFISKVRMPTVARKVLQLPFQRSKSGAMMINPSVLKQKVAWRLPFQSLKYLKSSVGKSALKTVSKTHQDTSEGSSNPKFVAVVMKPFTCTYCGAIFTVVSEYCSHELKCKKEPTMCEVCGVTISAKMFLKRHMKSHSGKFNHEKSAIFICETCGKKFKSEDSLKHHRAVLHNDGTVDEMQRPKDKQHTSFVCETCGKRMKTKETLKYHRATFHSGENGDGERKCELCDKTFKNKNAFSRHLITYHPDHNDEVEPISYCESCCRVFCSSESYKTHLKLHKKGLVKTCLNLQLVASEGPNSEEIFSCPVCGLGFPDKMQVIKHMNVKDLKKCNECKQQVFNERSFFAHKCKWRCQYCDKRFWSRLMRKLHEQVHTGERTYMCHRCGLKLSSAQSLRRHHRSHDMPVLQCELCPKVFRNEVSYQIHLETHRVKTDKPLYKCEQCNKPFNNGVLFKIHMERHDRVYYNCMYCGKQLMYWKSLQSHCKKFHEISLPPKESFNTQFT